MSTARITIEVNGERKGIELRSLNLDESRDGLALEVGRVIVDGIWSLEVGE